MIHLPVYRMQMQSNVIPGQHSGILTSRFSRRVKVLGKFTRARREHSMGCAMGLWLIAQNPGLFRLFTALRMGSAFEPWEQDDGGIDLNGLSTSAGIMRILLAVDQSDPAGTNLYIDENLVQLRRLGLQVETFRPNAATHQVTEEMKAAMLRALPN
jgi:hypothetical protein